MSFYTELEKLFLSLAICIFPRGGLVQLETLVFSRFFQNKSKLRFQIFRFSPCFVIFFEVNRMEFWLVSPQFFSHRLKDNIKNHASEHPSLLYDV